MSSFSKKDPAGSHAGRGYQTNQNSLCKRRSKWASDHRYGYQPQRAALLIYWQALKLMWKGVPFHGPPSCCFKEKVTKDAKQPKMSTGEPFLWKGAEGFPWNLDQ